MVKHSKVALWHGSSKESARDPRDRSSELASFNPELGRSLLSLSLLSDRAAAEAAATSLRFSGLSPSLVSVFAPDSPVRPFRAPTDSSGHVISASAVAHAVCSVVEATGGCLPPGVAAAYSVLVESGFDEQDRPSASSAPFPEPLQAFSTLVIAAAGLPSRVGDRLPPREAVSVRKTYAPAAAAAAMSTACAPGDVVRGERQSAGAVPLPRPLVKRAKRSAHADDASIDVASEGSAFYTAPPLITLPARAPTPVLAASASGIDSWDGPALLLPNWSAASSDAEQFSAQLHVQASDAARARGLSMLGVVPGIIPGLEETEPAASGTILSPVPPADDGALPDVPEDDELFSGLLEACVDSAQELSDDLL